MTTPVGQAAVALALAARERGPLSLGAPSDGLPPLLGAGVVSFDAAVLEALAGRGAAPVAAMPPAGAPPVRLDRDPVDMADRAPALPEREATVIVKEADRTSVDPALLVALRRAENGGPGREFGVLSATADGLEAQARVAATTVRNNVARFERGGGIAVDPATRRYTEGFLRFFSARYAPVGAANDPSGLNRHHAANLIALYRKASGGAG